MRLWMVLTFSRLSLAFERGLVVITKEGEYGFRSQLERMPKCRCFEWKLTRAMRLAREGPQQESWDERTYELMKESMW